MDIDSHLNKCASMLEMFYKDKKLEQEIKDMKLKEKLEKLDLILDDKNKSSTHTNNKGGAKI